MMDVFLLFFLLDFYTAVHQLVYLYTDVTSTRSTPSLGFFVTCPALLSPGCFPKGNKMMKPAAWLLLVID